LHFTRKIAALLIGATPGNVRYETGLVSKARHEFVGRLVGFVCDPP
jgi:hypothetical protein